MSVDPKPFKDFEHEGWQRVPIAYERGFGDVTTQAIPHLLNAVGAGAGMRLLDVACGPGYAAAAAAERGAETLGVDFASEMVRLARSRYPHLQFTEGDAEHLDLPDGVFDAAVMNFGMLHLADPDRAIAEAFRVLKPGGRYAFTVWDLPERAVGFDIVLGAIKTHGDMNVPLPPGPPFFRFSDRAECLRTLESLGFSKVHSVQVPQIWRLETGEALLETFRGGAVRTAALLNLQTPEALEAIRTAIIESTLKFQKGAGVELPMPAILTSAVKRK